MRILDAATRQDVQLIIGQHLTELEGVPGFVGAEPGFPIVDGKILREPAILVFVMQKRPSDSLLSEDRVPRQLGRYRVAVMQADPLRQLNALAEHLDVADALTVPKSKLTYKGIANDPIDKEFTVSSPLLCHVGPDAGWPVLKPFLEAATSTLTVAMYDFNADYIAKTFIDAVRHNGLAAALTWDDSMTAPETEIRTQLKKKLLGRLDGAIVQCGSNRRFASAYHEKVAVRDSTSFWLSSGNWSLRSQPNIDPVGVPDDAKGMYAKGNREWHVIVDDEDLAKLYELYIQHDLDDSKSELAAGAAGAALDAAELLQLPDLFVPLDSLLDQVADSLSVPEPTAPALLPSSARDVKVIPLLTPDNYLERVKKLLSGATRSVYLQFAYINYSDKAGDEGFTELLGQLAELSWKPGMDVRIIVGSNDAADKVRLLAEAGFNDRVFRSQRNIHNKGIVVDGKRVLVSSANWSGDGVLRNRDAGLIIQDAEIAHYYEQVFLDDWDNRASAMLADDAPVLVASQDAATPAGMVRMSWRDYFG